MKKFFKNKNGISLVSIIMIGIIVIVVIYIAIIVLKNGIKVMSKAKTAQKTTNNNQITEEVDIILANFKAENASAQRQMSFENFLNKTKEDGYISNYWFAQSVAIIKYNNNYVLLIPNNDSYTIVGIVYIENDEYANKAIENYKKSIDRNSKEKIAFEDKNTYIISSLVRPDCYEYSINDYQDVTIAIISDLEINNKNFKKSAIEMGSNSALKLYVFGNVIISSLYNGNENIEYNSIMSDGGYAGIHVQESSSLKIYGTGNLTVYGGPAGKGGTYNESDLTLGSGGGRSWSWYWRKWRFWWWSWKKTVYSRRRW